jgi:hypothetical protein
VPHVVLSAKVHSAPVYICNVASGQKVPGVTMNGCEFVA